jgi:hypothetical protein
MKALVLAITAASLLTGGPTLAQVTQGGGAGGTTTKTTTVPPRMPNDTPASLAGSAGADRDSRDTAAASGNRNQAVATTQANAPAPAKGANSFTMGEARSRMEKNGFSDVSDLAKDDSGIWRGKAQKGGNATSVWLDYKGNVGATN